MRAFVVTHGKDGNVLVMFRDPVEVFAVERDCFVDLFCALSDRKGMLSIADLQHVFAGVGVFTVTREGEAALRSALRKTTKERG